MKNDINIIKNEIIEELDRKKQAEKEKQEKKDFQDFKVLCKHLVYTSLRMNLDNGIKIDDLYLFRDTMLNKILNEIKSKTKKVIDTSTWEDKEKIVREYPYQDFIIEDLLNQYFISEYKRVKSELKEENTIYINQLSDKLENKFKELIVEGQEDNLTLSQLFYGFKLEETKQDVIDLLSDNENDYNILNKIYNKTLNNLSKQYNYEKLKPQTKPRKKRYLGLTIMLLKRLLK